MLNKFIYLLIAFSILSCHFTENKKSNKKHEIIIESNYYASLSWWGLKQLGFVGDISPKSKYLLWRNKLSKAGEDIKFKAPVAGGPLFTFIYQLPGYIGPENKEDFQKIMKGCIYFVKSGSIEKLQKDWPEQTQYLEKWYNSVYIDIVFKDIGKNKKDVIETLEIWSEYIVSIWDQYKPIYNSKMKDYPFDTINAHYRASLILHQWDSIMGFEYPFDKFIVCICPESRTTASSLGPEKIVFSSKYSKKILEHSIVHECGVRYFPFDEFAKRGKSAEIMRADYDNFLRIIETEVCFRKTKILKIKRDYFLTGMQLENILEFRSNKYQKELDIFEFITQLYIEAKKDSIIR